jgi:nitrogen fixation NifU-like protein
MRMGAGGATALGVVDDRKSVKNMETKHYVHIEDAIAVDSPGGRFWQHARNPRNLGVCATPSACAVGVGSCGDKIRVDLRIVDDVLQEVKCIPQGCIYTQACASAMSVLATGRSIEQALKLQPGDVSGELEGLPEDHLHCARLAVNTLGDAIAEYYRLHFAIDKNGRSRPPEPDGKE